MSLKSGHAPPPSFGFLVHGHERVKLATFRSSGRFHLVRADDPRWLGCGRSAEGATARSTATLDWLRVNWQRAPSLGWCRRCLDAFERSMTVYAAPGVAAEWQREGENGGQRGPDRGGGKP